MSAHLTRAIVSALTTLTVCVTLLVTLWLAEGGTQTVSHPVHITEVTP